jgi:subtilisin family serine protease
MRDDRATRDRRTSSVVLLALPLIGAAACTRGASNNDPPEQSQQPLTVADSPTAESTTVTEATEATAAAAPDATTAKKKVVWVMMKDKATLTTAAATKDWKARGANVRNALVSTATQSQSSLRSLLTSKGVAHRPFWIVNAIKMEADQTTIDQVGQRADVARIVPDGSFAIPPSPPSRSTPKPQGIEWGLQNIHAPEAWSAYGFKGEGIVVANVDTGVEFTHPALARQYRGKLPDGTVDHNYNWFDPSKTCGNPSLAPCDNAGHGTHTMGTMVGDDGDPGENQIGVAPHARWIAAKGCESSSCSYESLLASGEWILAPTDLNGQNPRTDLRPHIVNNSWGGGSGDTFYQGVVQAWVEAGIFPSFSIGNSGSSCGSANSPGDYPESYGSGAYDVNNVIAYFSSLGPSMFGMIKPNIAAPGVNVRSSVPGGSYDWYSGTSMASPHLAGTVALVWSAAPTLIGDIAGTRAILDQSAVDTEDLTCGGDAGNNNVWGQGRLNALEALNQAPIGDTGTLTGQVTDTDTNQPVPGATLLVQAPETRDRTVRVDPDGNFSARISVGTYTVTAKAFGFYDQVVPGVTITKDTTTTQNFAIKSAPSFALSGTVRTAAGVALPGAVVTVLGTPLAPATADANGQYSFPSVPAGSYQVRAQGTACYQAMDQAVTVAGNTTLDFAIVQRVDGYGYSCAPATYAYIQANTVLPINYSSYTADVTLPFPFTLYGQTYEAATVTANGYLTFHLTKSSYYYNTPIPDPTEPNAAVYPFWDDIMIDSSSSVRTEVLGTAPKRQLVIEWRNVMSWETGVRTNFEVVLYEDSHILMQYVSGQDAWQQGLMATIGLEDDTGTTAFQYSYNQATVAPQSAVLYSLPPSGIVQGTISNVNDGTGVAGATVQAVKDGKVVRSATTTKSGFYRLLVPAGAYSVQVSAKNYDAAQAQVSVALDQTVEQSFQLKAGIASLSPANIQLLMPTNQTRTRSLVLKNTGSAPITFDLAESGGRKVSLTPTRSLARVQTFSSNAFTTKGLFSNMPASTGVGTDAAGDVLFSFVPSGMNLPWGVGVTSNLWLSDPPVNRNSEFTFAGVATGKQWSTPWGDWGADMAVDDNRGLVCQLVAGGDNGIHCWKPDTGAEADKIAGSFPWTNTSQRGLAYRPDDDSFYVGGWNEGVIYHIKGLGAADKGTVIGSCRPADGNISGLAYNASVNVLWVATNSPTDTIYELNPDDCTVLSMLPHPAAGFAGGGLDMDASGDLWMVNQNASTVFLMESGVPAFSDVPWLKATPISGSVAIGKSASISVKVDTTGLAAGMYLANLFVRTTAAKQALVRVPISLVVTAYQQGVIAGGKAYTDTQGDAWAADQAYKTGGWGYVQKSKTDSTNKTIGGTTEQPLFKTQRIDPYAYRFDKVPNGIYQVDMNFAELTNIKLGKRLYDVIVENTVVLPAHDIVYEVGNLKADKHTFFIEVTDGQMDVRLIPRAGYEAPVINSLRVTHRPDR